MTGTGKEIIHGVEDGETTIGGTIGGTTAPTTAGPTEKTGMMVAGIRDMTTETVTAVIVGPENPDRPDPTGDRTGDVTAAATGPTEDRRPHRF